MAAKDIAVHIGSSLNRKSFMCFLITHMYGVSTMSGNCMTLRVFGVKETVYMHITLQLNLSLNSEIQPTFLIFSVGEGGWAFDGIEMTSVTENDDGQMVVNCQSTHLTSFAVLVDVSGSLSVSLLHVSVVNKGSIILLCRDYFRFNVCT